MPWWLCLEVAASTLRAGPPTVDVRKSIYQGGRVAALLHCKPLVPAISTAVSRLLWCFLAVVFFGKNGGMIQGLR
jgi:hypothetical protein